MAKIYRDFEELVQKNKHLFDILGDEEISGLYRAIWSARDAEIDEYKRDLKKFQESYAVLEESLLLYKDESLLFEEAKLRYLQELSQKKNATEESVLKVKNLQKQCLLLEEAQSSYKEIMSSLEEDKKKLLLDIQCLGQDGTGRLKDIKALQEKNKRLYAGIEKQKLYLERLRSLYKKETAALNEEIHCLKESEIRQQKSQELALSQFEKKKRNHLLEINKLTVKLKEREDAIAQTTSRFEEKDAYSKKLEDLHNKQVSHLKQLTQKTDDLEQSHEQLYKELDYQRELVYSLTMSLEQKDAEIETLTALLEKAKTNSKQYKYLNNKMSTEMAEIGREVETLKIALS